MLSTTTGGAGPQRHLLHYPSPKMPSGCVLWTRRAIQSLWPCLGPPLRVCSPQPRCTRATSEGNREGQLCLHPLRKVLPELRAIQLPRPSLSRSGSGEGGACVGDTGPSPPQAQPAISWALCLGGVGGETNAGHLSGL